MSCIQLAGRQSGILMGSRLHKLTLKKIVDIFTIAHSDQMHDPSYAVSSLIGDFFKENRSAICGNYPRDVRASSPILECTACIATR